MKYAFLGAGKLATAIIQGMLRGKVCAAEDIIAACPEVDVLQSLHNATSVCVSTSNEKAAGAAPVVMLCVKPQEATLAIEQAGSALDGKLLISIAAGLSLATLEKMAPKCRVIRAMPNTPALIGRAATAFTGGANATQADKDCAEAIFASVGVVSYVQEKLLDAVTGLSGSGPGFVALLIEALADGGVKAGLPRALAQALAVQTVAGTAALIDQTGEHPAQIKDRVASPGGTTIAGLAVLEQRAVRGALIDAVVAAADRARVLGRPSDG